MTCICTHPPDITGGCPVHDPEGFTLPNRVTSEIYRRPDGSTFTQYRCLDCRCHVNPRTHVPGSTACDEARDERIWSRCN